MVPDLHKLKADTIMAIIECARENLYPEDIFTVEQLGKWAQDNGWIKEKKPIEPFDFSIIDIG